MPNKYEREIEEILRNLEQPERPDARPGLSNRIRAFNRPRPRPRRTWDAPVNLTLTEWYFAASVILTLIAAALTYYLRSSTNPNGQLVLVHNVPVLDIISVNGIIALAAFAALVTALIRGWREQFGGVSSMTRRGASPGARSHTTWQSNVVDMTPRSHNPVTAVKTQVRILRLKWRYLRMRERNS